MLRYNFHWAICPFTQGVKQWQSLHQKMQSLLSLTSWGMSSATSWCCSPTLAVVIQAPTCMSALAFTPAVCLSLAWARTTTTWLSILSGRSAPASFPLRMLLRCSKRPSSRSMMRWLCLSSCNYKLLKHS